MLPDTPSVPYIATTWVVPLLLGITLHEAAHAPVLFGYARAVPVQPGTLRRPRRDMMLVAAAGPVSNLVQAIVALRLLDLLADPGDSTWLTETLARAIAVNVSLAIFNLLPIPPLDGAHIAIGLLPRQLSRSLAALMPHGMTLIIGLVVVLPAIGHALGLRIDLLGQGISRLIRLTIDGLVWLGG